MALGWNPQTIPMVQKVFIGLAVTSHSPGNTVVAHFSDVSTTGNVAALGPWRALALTDPATTLNPCMPSSKTVPAERRWSLTWMAILRRL